MWQSLRLSKIRSNQPLWGKIKAALFFHSIITILNVLSGRSFVNAVNVISSFHYRIINQPETIIVPKISLGFSFLLAFLLIVQLWMTPWGQKIPMKYLNLAGVVTLISPLVLGAIIAGGLRHDAFSAGYVICDPKPSRSGYNTFGRSYEACRAAGFPSSFLWDADAARRSSHPANDRSLR